MWLRLNRVPIHQQHLHGQGNLFAFCQSLGCIRQDILQKRFRFSPLVGKFLFLTKKNPEEFCLKEKRTRNKTRKRSVGVISLEFVETLGTWWRNQEINSTAESILLLILCCFSALGNIGDHPPSAPQRLAAPALLIFT